MSLSPIGVALAPIMVALFAVLTFIASMGPDAATARPAEKDLSASGSAIEVAPSVTIPRPGVSGTILAGPELADLNHDGVSEAIFGTERGYYRIANGEVEQYIPTSTEVRQFAIVKDVTGDAVDDIALALGDTTFPNVRLYDSASGKELWNFVPAQDVFIENLMWTSLQTEVAPVV